MKPEGLRVRAPSRILFLCGGVIDPKVTPPVALRDHFYRYSRGGGASYKIVLAEDAQPLTADAGYLDLLSFESDIAQVVGLILLFAESAGSLAELGAFAASKTIAPSLLAILDDHYYSQSSFIRNGPVKYLENEYGDEWILVIERNEIGISAAGTLENVDPLRLGASVQPAIERRLSRKHVFEKFNPSNSGHAILLLTGLCQEFGALTLGEISKSLNELGVPLTATTMVRLKNYIYCSELLGWLKKIRKGNYIFYAATGGEAALDYTLDPNHSLRDKVRWRTDIRAYWQKHEAVRLRAAADALAVGLTP